MPNFHHNPELLSELIFAMEMSQGEFRLFLARSNTLTQRDRLIEKLQTSFSGDLAQLHLDESVGELYETICQHLGDKAPDALMIWGLESVTDVDQLLISMGLVREEFKNNFHFPILLWIDKEISRKFIRLIPDFESWTSLTVFETPTQELIDFIQQTSNCVYQKVLENGAGIFLEHTALGVGEFIYQELLDAQQELSNRGVELEPKLEAGLEFVLGRTADNSEETALKHYQRSLELWQQLDNQVRVAHTYYYLGLLWRSYELWHRVDKDTGCSRSASYYQKSVETFETANYPDLAAKFINAWGEILQTLELWDKLETVANRAIELHQTYSHPFREACAYGFLAEVELTKNNYQQAKKLAQKSLKILKQTLAKASNCTSRKEEINLDLEFSYHQGQYLFSLAKTEKALGEIKGSIASLEQAKYTTKPEYNAELYIDILTELGGIYYQQKEYLKAFKIKQKRQKIEQQFGFQAFIGANRLSDIKLNLNPALPHSKRRINQEKVTQEIPASGRQSDVEILMERISRPDYKLIVIHGPSGVGKSSILQAGLVPTLEGKSIDTRDVVVIVQRVYVHWVSELGKVLEKKQQITANLTVHSESINSVEAIFSQLKKNAQSNLLTVIIFDQFEEFFFANMELKDKREFAKFLQECLKIPFVKIVLSLRSDYIHYLLEFDRLANLEAINNDILSKNILYCLGNFSQSQAKSVIQGLTENSQFKIDERLTEKLVEDLAEELGEIRPIELQVMGAQLQRDDITTLEKYLELGDNPKAELVERYLESVVRDCGAENEKLAWLVLLLFTDENNTRPLKTKVELVKESNFNSEELELVLNIFVDSGLVFLLPHNPADHYQLVHDYLVGFIRQRKEGEIRQELKQEKEKRVQLQKRLFIGSVAATLVMAVLAIGMMVFGLDAKYERRRADKERRLAEKQTMLAKANEAKAHSILGQRLDELISAMNARQKQIDNGFPLTNETSIITNALRVAVYKTNQDEFREFNRLRRNQNKLSDVEFSPDGEIIATASDDGTVKFWNQQGQLLQILKGHNSLVSDVEFSPDGEMIATASDDGTVKFWNQQGQVLHTIKGHNSLVYDVEFSPDGEMIATASDDGTVKFW
ncbi:eIF2A-related protein, partial [Dapis sp. BLCC M126]|uniref:nSTAND1 domain-containing NTPase n=1 Tax=Dapis sp. BLCC M126 TaxID=3400189 RepID=UPI003CF22277